MGRIAALFDLDHTLLDTSLGQLYARYLYRHGQMVRGEIVRVGWWAMLTRWLAAGVFEAMGGRTQLRLDAALPPTRARLRTLGEDVGAIHQIDACTDQNERKQ